MSGKVTINTKDLYTDGRDGLGKRMLNPSGFLHSYFGAPSTVKGSCATWHRSGDLHNDSDLPSIVENGRKFYWFKEGKLHRDNDKPAIIITGSYLAWYKNGEKHRLNYDPAEIDLISGEDKYWVNGTKYILKDGVSLNSKGTLKTLLEKNVVIYYNHLGKKHRDNGPAVVDHTNCTYEYWVNGYLHRDDDKPAVIYKNGDHKYYFYGLLHRDNGPAIAMKGGKVNLYYCMGLLHREGNLPAIEYASGKREYWVFGVNVDTGETQSNRAMEKKESTSKEIILASAVDDDADEYKNYWNNRTSGRTTIYAEKKEDEIEINNITFETISSEIDSGKTLEVDMDEIAKTSRYMLMPTYGYGFGSWHNGIHYFD